MAQDLDAFSSKKPWQVLIGNIWQMVGQNRKVEANDFRGKGVTNPLFFMMYVLARLNKARDLETGNIINYSNFGRNNEIEYDHIFPKSKLDEFLKKKDVSDSDRKILINELCNFAFMTKKGNIIKTNEDPKDYFPKVYKKYGKDVFDSQQMPYNPSLMEYESYQEYLNKRSEILAEEINGYLDKIRLT